MVDCIYTLELTREKHLLLDLENTRGIRPKGEDIGVRDKGQEKKVVEEYLSKGKTYSLNITSLEI